MLKPTNALFRSLFYLNIEIFLVVLFLYVFNNNTYIGNYTLYVNTQIVASILAFIAGIMALIKYYTRYKSKYIFIGFGLLGASLMEIFHTSLNSASLYTHFWKWNPSLVYLAIFVVVSYIVWYIEVVVRQSNRIKKSTLFLSVSAIFVILFFALSTINLSKNTIVYLTVIPLIPTIGLFLKKGVWKLKYFEFWFVAGLIIAVWSNLLFLQISVQPHDLAFVVFQLLKVVTYATFLLGLLMSTFNAFLLIEHFGQSLQARLKASILSFPLGYVLFNADGEIELTNTAIHTLFGTTNNNDLKQILNNTIKLDMLMFKCREQKRSIKLDDFTFNNKFLDIFLTPIINEDEFVGVVILMHDITEEKLLDKTKDEFIALASHELRTPLSAIKGNVELLNDHYEKVLVKNNIKQMIDDIYESSIRLINIVEEFLDITNLEQRRISFKKEKFDAYQLVQESAESMRELAKQQKNNILTEKIGTGAFMVKADKTRTRQILFNLIGNSIKFTQEGEIKLIVKKIDQSYIEIQIADTGRGITVQSQKILFKKFQQVDEDILLHDSTKGVGLGLYISKMLAEGMDGDLRLLNSEINKGTTFALKLPLT